MAIAKHRGTEFAPFDEAMRRPGSFVAALVALVGAVYGDAPLTRRARRPGHR